MVKKYKSVFLTPIIVATVFTLYFAANGFFPFGKSSVSWCDMTQQVIPLLCDFKDIMLGKEGFFLSLQNSGGMNFFGVFFFFLASPFSFLVIFFEKADIPLLMNIILVLKLCVCASTAALYFEKRFKNLSFGFKSILSVSYAFCGYAMLFYQNIIWLDVMYLFPILMLGIHSLIEKGRTLLLIFSLTATVIVNFYISYMVILFLVLYFGVYTIYNKKIDYLLYLKLGISALVSMMLSAVVWLPSFSQYSSSGRKSDILEGLMYCDFFTAVETCVPILLATSLIFAVLIPFISELSGKSNEIKMSVAVFIIMCIPIFIEPINRMWHTGNYMSFPVRYGFITIFSGLIATAYLLENFESENKKSYKGLYVVIFGISMGAFVLWFTGENLETLSRYAQTLWGDRQSYHGILTLFLCLLFAEVIGILLLKKKIIAKNTLILLLAVTVICESYTSLMIYITPSKDSLDMTEYTAFCELENIADDNEFYRVNMSEKLTDANMTGAIGYNSLGHYTSLTDNNYMNAIKGFGYSGYWMEIGNWNGNIISDALLAVKYRIVETNNGYAIKENPLSLGFVTPSGYELPKELPKSDRATVMGDIYLKMFSLKQNPVIKYNITTLDNCEYVKDKGVHHLTELGSNNSIVYELDIIGEQILYFDCFNGGSNNLNEPINNSFSVYVNGSPISQSYPSQNKNGMLELGTFKDESVTVFLQLNKSVSCYSFGVFGFDVNAIKTAVSDLNVLKTEVKGSTVITEIPDSYSGEMFLSLPYNDGYKITLNGEKIDYSRCLTGFTSVNIEHGGKLKISFTPPKFVLGLIISILGIIAVVILYLFQNKLELLSDIIKKSAFILFMAVLSAFIILIYLMPIVANLVS